jgi:hypothetical protein
MSLPEKGSIRAHTVTFSEDAEDTDVKTTLVAGVYVKLRIHWSLLAPQLKAEGSNYDAEDLGYSEGDYDFSDSEGFYQRRQRQANLQQIVPMMSNPPESVEIVGISGGCALERARREQNKARRARPVSPKDNQFNNCHPVGAFNMGGY